MTERDSTTTKCPCGEPWQASGFPCKWCGKKPTMPDSTTTRYRPHNRPEFFGKTREECIDGWAQEPGLDRFWAESKFDQLVQAGHLVEINDAP